MAARGDRAIRRGHWRALDRKAGGATLIEQEGATRTTGSGLGQRRAGARAGAKVHKARNIPRGWDRDHRFRRRFQESLNITRNRDFQIGEGGLLRGQTAEGLCGTWPSPRTKHGKRQRTVKSARLREDRVQKRETGGTTQEGKPGESGQAPGRNYDSGSRESGRAASGQQARICRALRFQISR